MLILFWSFLCSSIKMLHHPVWTPIVCCEALPMQWICYVTPSDPLKELTLFVGSSSWTPSMEESSSSGYFFSLPYCPSVWLIRPTGRMKRFSSLMGESVKLHFQPFVLSLPLIRTDLCFCSSVIIMSICGVRGSPGNVQLTHPMAVTVWHPTSADPLPPKWG